MTARHTPANALRRSVREATAKTDTAVPTTHPSIDPTSDKQALMSPLTTGNPDARGTAAPATTPSRSLLHMQLMPEALARVHMQERLQEAEHERLLHAMRLRRRAERATLRARRALAGVVMQ
ncbi:hypothetical protein ABIA33_001233 [Streptacidiphilus sp. MAP12-16]|uniref:hypothetical protein n=1 Tax=Streptacidiphilus sp. MAP12-16 TaxID=3156300 RepID=UPI003519B356